MSDTGTSTNAANLEPTPVARDVRPIGSSMAIALMLMLVDVHIAGHDLLPDWLGMLMLAAITLAWVRGVGGILLAMLAGASAGAWIVFDYLDPVPAERNVALSFAAAGTLLLLAMSAVLARPAIDEDGDVARVPVLLLPATVVVLLAPAAATLLSPGHVRALLDGSDVHVSGWWYWTWMAVSLVTVLNWRRWGKEALAARRRAGFPAVGVLLVVASGAAVVASAASSLAR